MKKISNTAFVYTIVALVAGVVYREYTKVVGFSGKTNLSLLHTHLFTLGMLFFFSCVSIRNNIKVK